MIGVFDSGIGGLSVVGHIKARNPKIQIIYYGDLARVPYGDRPKEEVIQYFEEGKAFLKDKGVNKIIIACNTVVAVTGEGMEMIVAGEKKAKQASKYGRIGVIGTTRTIEIGIYKCKFALACPTLVPRIESENVEQGDLEAVVSFVKEKKLDTLILGCTHYPLIMDMFKKVLPGINLVDPGKELVKTMVFNSDKGEDEYWFT